MPPPETTATQPSTLKRLLTVNLFPDEDVILIMWLMFLLRGFESEERSEESMRAVLLYTLEIDFMSQEMGRKTSPMKSTLTDPGRAVRWSAKLGLGLPGEICLALPSAI